jgi:thioredoxin 1
MEKSYFMFLLLFCSIFFIFGLPAIKNVIAVAPVRKHVIDVESVAHFNELIERAQRGNKILLVDFFAEWCPVCRSMHPVFEKLAKKKKEKALFAKVDTDKRKDILDPRHPALTDGIHGIPTFVYIKDGKEIDRIVGRVKLLILEEKLSK